MVTDLEGYIDGFLPLTWWPLGGVDHHHVMVTRGVPSSCFLVYKVSQEVSQDGHVLAFQVTYSSRLLALTAAHDKLRIVL